MKIQYLGDSKDSFKWDYLDYLANFLKFPTLHIIFMMTPPDKTRQGKTRPDPRFRECVIDFCNKLRRDRDPRTAKRLPEYTGSTYSVVIHEPIDLRADNRVSYFSRVPTKPFQLVFIDPDKGFEPETSFSEQHICYAQIGDILRHLPAKSVICVFQHFRYIAFKQDFARIRERLGKCNATAICWHSVMFVAVSRSEEAISCVRDANQWYAEDYPFLKPIP